MKSKSLDKKSSLKLLTMISFVLSSSINVILPSIAPIWIASISYSFQLETLFFSNNKDELLVNPENAQF